MYIVNENCNTLIICTWINGQNSMLKLSYQFFFHEWLFIWLHRETNILAIKFCYMGNSLHLFLTSLANYIVHKEGLHFKYYSFLWNNNYRYWDINELKKRNAKRFMIHLSYFTKDTLSNKSSLLLGLEAHL